MRQDIEDFRVARRIPYLLHFTRAQNLPSILRGGLAPRSEIDAGGQCGVTILTVESAFQGSKVFESGGPFVDIFDMEPIDAKRDERLRASGDLLKFSFFGVDWPLEPKTAFYDWLYINALLKNEDLASRVTDIDGFTDIEFNPERSINCQARAAALYCALFHSDQLDKALVSPEVFRSMYVGRVSDPHHPSEVQYLI